MKKLIIGLLVLLFAAPCFARLTLYGELNKRTNGGYVAKLPALEWVGGYKNILLENELSLLYTAPRSSATSLNHHSIDNNFSMGFQDVIVKGSFATISLGLRYNIAGNSDGLAEGLELYNTARIGMEI